MRESSGHYEITKITVMSSHTRQIGHNMSNRDCVNSDLKLNYCVIKCVYIQGSEIIFVFLSLLRRVKSFNRFHD